MYHFAGEATGLLHPNSKDEVAVKTVNDPSDGAQRTALLCEIKILSNLDLHLNLVNMMGCCTTEFVQTGELFMLLEFCEKGNAFIYNLCVKARILLCAMSIISQFTVHIFISLQLATDSQLKITFYFTQVI